MFETNPTSATAEPPSTGAGSAQTQRDVEDFNRRFYDRLWSGARFVAPERFNTWPLVQALLPAAPRRLEVAPGLRPRLPLAGTHFLDISLAAVTELRRRGADAGVGLISALPFATGAVDLVCALDVVEHVDDEATALSELARVAAPGGALLLSVPLHPEMWTAFDDFVGHRRRYEPARLVDRLAHHGFRVEQSASYGMRPQSSRLVDAGNWFLTHHRAMAMRWYNRAFMPIALRLQKPLRLVPGMADTDGVEEALLVCRKLG